MTDRPPHRRRTRPPTSTRRARALAGCVLAVLVVLCGTWASSPAGATGRSPAQADDLALEVASVSPWVDADGVFEVAFAPSTAVPLDSTLSYTVHQRLRPSGDGTLRQRTDDVLDGDDPGGILQATVTTRSVELGNPVEGMVLRVPVSSTGGGDGAAFLPTAGIHPVVLRLDAADGTALWSTTVFLNRLPTDPVTDPDGRPARLALSLVVPIEGPPSLAPDGRTELDAETRADVAAATGLLSQVPEAPLVLGLRPNTLTGVTRSPTGTDSAFVQALRSPTVRATIARRTDVAVDTGGLVAADAPDALIQQLDLGGRIVQTATGRVPTVDTWLLDETVSPESLTVVAGVGTRRVVVPAERLRLPDGVPEEIARSRALALQGSPDLTAIADDPTLTLRLVDPQVEPGLRANRATTALMASWFTAADEGAAAFPGPSAVVVLPAGTDPEVVRAMLPVLAGDGPVTGDPGALPPAPSQVAGESLTAALAPRLPTDQQGPVAAMRSTRTLIDSFTGISRGAEPLRETWELLNSETLSTQMDPGRRTETHATIRAQVDERVRAIGLPPERRVVLTTREAAVPLRFRNDLPYPVEVRVRIRSPRLEIDGGQIQTLVLDPGENRIDLDVTVQAPGAAILRIDVTSPDGRIEVGQSALPVTSSRISGVGAVLSVLSLLVLAGWWISTWRRSRRERTGADADLRDGGDGATGPEGEPVAVTGGGRPRRPSRQR